MDSDTCNNSFFQSVIACVTHASIAYCKIIPNIFKMATNKQNYDSQI